MCIHLLIGLSTLITAVLRVSTYEYVYQQFKIVIGVQVHLDNAHFLLDF